MPSLGHARLGVRCNTECGDLILGLVVYAVFWGPEPWEKRGSTRLGDEVMTPGLIDAENRGPAKDPRSPLRRSGYSNIADMSWFPVGRRGTTSASRSNRKEERHGGGLYRSFLALFLARQDR